MPELVVDEVRIHYESTPPRAQRVPLVLTHGYASCGGMWKPNLAALSSQRQVVTWDLRGHGASDSPPDLAQYSKERSVADLAAVVHRIRAERAVLGGLSLGGYLSLAFTLAHPERVTALVLCDTGPGFKRDEPRAAWNRMAEAAARRWEAGQMVVSPHQPEVAEAGVQNGRGLALAARGLVAQHDRRVIDGLDQIGVPTLVVVGSRDTDFRVAAEYLAAKIPAAQLVVIADAGHAANMDQPSRFNGSVLDFLAALP